jgi:dihydrofolate reductase
MSLDGFVAGPSQSVENPLGIGGTRLREWAVKLAVVVLTQHAHAPLELEGGTTFTFVTNGIDAALGLAMRAAQQYLAAGLVDEMEINLVPTLLGCGERLFNSVGDRLHGLELVRTVAAPKVTHLKFAKRCGLCRTVTKRTAATHSCLP